MSAFPSELRWCKLAEVGGDFQVWGLWSAYACSAIGVATDSPLRLAGQPPAQSQAGTLSGTAESTNASSNTDNAYYR